LNGYFPKYSTKRVTGFEVDHALSPKNNTHTEYTLFMPRKSGVGTDETAIYFLS
jgi:hypothetical protein